jgi:hypothetical protein
MKLILKHHWCVPYEADGDTLIPFEYSSKEQAFVDFFEAKEKALSEENYSFEFLDQKWSSYEDLEHDVDFYELNEWFDRFKVDNSANKA